METQAKSFPNRARAEAHRAVRMINAAAPGSTEGLLASLTSGSVPMSPFLPTSLNMAIPGNLQIVPNFDAVTVAHQFNVSRYVVPCQFLGDGRLVLPRYWFAIVVECLYHDGKANAYVVLPETPVGLSAQGPEGRWSGEQNGLIVHIPNGGFGSTTQVLKVDLDGVVLKARVDIDGHTFDPRQTTCCSLLGPDALTPAGTTAGYFGASPTMGVQLVISKPPVAAYTDDAYSSCLTVTRQAGELDPASWLPLRGNNTIRVCRPRSWAGVKTDRQFDVIQNPTELLARTGEKKGADFSRFGGTRAGEVKGEYVHYNEVIVDPTTVT